MKSLFEETHIGSIHVKNRFIRSATWENMTSKDGHMTPRLLDVYKKLAEGETGLIITGYANVLEEEQPNPGMMGIYDDSFTDEYTELTDLVHSHGAKIVMQLAYGGTKTTYNVGERVIYTPSDVCERSTQTAGKPMTIDEIAYVVKAFADAGRRAKEAGFDGVEIHGAHTYLINQFLSPYYNRREDEYGGSLENRMRFLIEIYEAIRESVGIDFTILVKLTATEFFEGGLTFEETRKICAKMQLVGVDGIELSGNVHGKAKSLTGKSFEGYTIQKEGYFLEYGKVVSEDLDIPVITVGGLSDINTIEEILHSTHIEFFALSRPLLSEPSLIKRWKGGNREPAQCVRCSKCRTPNGNYCTIFNEIGQEGITAKKSRNLEV